VSTSTVPSPPDPSGLPGPTGSTGTEPRWLLLVYKIPAEPTRLRAGVWRKIRGLGAIYLQNSVAALPSSSAAERSLRLLRNEIVEMGGTAYLLESEALSGQAEISAAFNAARDDEYEEIVDKCEDFLGQVEKEYTANHFTYAELEENDEDLVKLRNWFAKVQARDVLGASGAEAVRTALGRCEHKLDEYAARVYAEEGEGR
jgi:hypothetical protein